MNQNEFMQLAMIDLGLTRDAFAKRLGCTRRTLEKWLLPEASDDYLSMPETVWNLVREIRAHERLKKNHEKLQNKVEQSV